MSEEWLPGLMHPYKNRHILIPEEGYVIVELTRRYRMEMDIEDLLLLAKCTVSALGPMKNREKVYAAYYDSVDRKTKYFHRLLLQVTDGQIHVDHLNGNTLNNCLCNLRQGSRSQNMRNMKIQKDCKTRIKGVTFNEARGYWRAEIGCGACGMTEKVCFSLSVHPNAKKRATEWHRLKEIQFGYLRGVEEQ